MKTNFISFPKPSLNSIIGFLSIFVMASCGSYQNTSYYDTDGIYGASERSYSPRETQHESNIAYKNYFSSLQDSIQNTPVLTDVEHYGNYNASTNQQASASYPGWGSNSQDVVINYYPDNWDFSFGFGNPYFGFGWGNRYNGWYSPYNYWDSPFGWGYPYYGYGYGFMNYPYYGWGHNQYGYSNYGYSYGNSYRNSNYSYNSSRRGSNYSQNSNPSRTYIGRTSSQDVSGYSNRMSNSPSFSRYSSSSQNQNSNINFGKTRRDSNNSNPQYSTPSRTYSPNATRRNDNYTPPSRTSSPNSNRSESYTPSRSSDSNYSRSSGGESSYGGGGRSSNGGGRRGGR